jgi:hypothetical protein
MRSVENRLTVLGGAAVAASGLFWMVPVLNTVSAVAGIVALILIVTRLGYSRGFSTALMGFILAFGTSSLTTGYLEGLYYAMFYALVVITPAMVMGWASRNLYRPLSVVCYGLIPFGILFVLFMYAYINWMQNITLVTDAFNLIMDDYIKSNPILSTVIEENYGPGENGMMAFFKEFDRFLESILKITPGFLLTVFLGTAVFGLVLSGYIGVKMGIIIPRFRPFYFWKASGWWLLPTIIGLVPVVFRMDELWFYAGLNILIVTGHVYMVVGLAIVEAYFRRIYVPLPIRIIFYVILILAGPVSMTFLAVLGLSDTKFAFKREIDEIENKDE